VPFGLYVVKESIDKHFLARVFGAANDQGNLYEGECCTDFSPDPSRLDLKDEMEEMRSRQDIIALAQLVHETPDAEWVARVGEKLDLANFIGGYAVDALVDNWDGYSFTTNNYFMYAEPGRGRFVFIPHGMDQLFGGQDPLREPRGVLARKTRQLPELQARFAAELRRVLGEPWDLGVLGARIDRVAAILHANPPTDETTAADFRRFDENVARVKAALASRKRWSP
jgi:hypothetical protein